MRTDLEEPAFRREDRDVAIIPGAATAPAHRGLGRTLAARVSRAADRELRLASLDL